MKLLTIISALSTICVAYCQPRAGTICTAGYTPDLYQAILNAINLARSRAANPAHRNPLRLVSDITVFAAYHVDDSNWLDTTCYPYNLYSFQHRTTICCPHAVGCTSYLLQNIRFPPAVDTGFFVGAKDLTNSELTFENVASRIPMLLSQDPFLFVTGQTGDTSPPNPGGDIPVMNKLGVGVSPSGDRLFLILGSTNDILNYSYCAVVDLPTEPAHSDISTTDTQTTVTQTTVTQTTGGTSNGATSVAGIPNGDHSLGVGAVAVGVAGITYLSF